ncbi:hypothetical protein [Derxia gummosa]|uniref:PpiC domain-containing protein n=1 Tax=Derxia gummosa DSM 723 TaxID=1121388 RepID=A0A8B6X491_9BURK|nr:hypothetical protein [Derxia gummosa]
MNRPPQPRRLAAALALAFALPFGAARAEAVAAPDAAAATATTPAVIAAAPVAGTATGQDGSALSATTAVLRVGESPVLWPECLFWMRQFVQAHAVADDDVLAPPPALPAAADLLAAAEHQARRVRAIEAEAAAAGITITADDEVAFARRRDAAIRQYGGLGEYLRIVARMYVSEDVLDRLGRLDLLGERLFAARYGEDGEVLSDAEVLAWAEAQGLVRLRYLRLAARDADGRPLAPAAREVRRRRLDAWRADLARVADPAARDAAFARLVARHGDDDAMRRAPEGRVAPAAALPAPLRTIDSAAPVLVRGADADWLVQRLPLAPGHHLDAGGPSLRRAAAHARFIAAIDARAAALDVMRTDAWARIDADRVRTLAAADFLPQPHDPTP